MDKARHQLRKGYSQSHKNGMSKVVLPLHCLSACGNDISC